MPQYPVSLPCPQIDGYQVNIDYGLTSVAFEHGNNRQRRKAKVEKHIFSMSLVLSIKQLWTWQSWANQFGFDWHTMNLESNYSGFTTETQVPHTIRYISDIDIEAIDADYVRVSFQAEMDSNTPPAGIVKPSGNWIVGRTPAAPPADWIIGGSPAAPSPSTITAGTPGLPAA